MAQYTQTAEYLQFIGMLVLMLAILIGAYGFAYVPERREEQDERRDQS